MSQAFPARTGPRVLFLLLSLVTFLALPVLGRAETPAESPNITIGGFIAYNYTFQNDLADDPLGGDNSSERNFDLRGEIDLGIRWDWASARFDLNLPSDGNEETGMVPTANNTLGIEQARFDLMPPFGQGINLTLTGGVFNSPIGLQHQDPDQMDSITDGLQFAMAPANLFGLDISAGSERFSIGAIIANEWHQDDNEQLTFGFHTKLSPTDKLSLSLGGLFTTDAIGDNYLLNSVASTSMIPWINLDLEGTVNDKNYAVGTAIRITRPEHSQCGAALRYEKVWASAGSDFTTRFTGLYPITALSPIDDHDFHLLSMTFFTEPLRHLKLQAEGRATQIEADAPGGNDETYYNLVAQAVYQF